MVVIPAPVARDGVESSGNGAIQTLIIDRQPLFLAALGSLLSAPTVGFQVLRALRSDVGLDAIRNGHVDLVCCEVNSEPIPGVELARILAEENSPTPVILLAEMDDEPHIAPALAAGVAGLFTKSADASEFVAGVRAILNGHRAIGSSVIQHILMSHASGNLRESRRFGSQLSPTELEILSMIGQAQSIPAIAASRGISHKTVRNHLAKIYRKLELHGRTEAMLWAARMGLTGS